MDRITDEIFGISLLSAINNILGEAQATGGRATNYAKNFILSRLKKYSKSTYDDQGERGPFFVRLFEEMIFLDNDTFENLYKPAYRE